MNDEQRQPCPNCGHPWAAHHQHPDWGFGIKGRCDYTPYRGFNCSCMEPNPRDVREKNYAKAMWDMTMGRGS